jgi:hypothetical protein
MAASRRPSNPSKHGRVVGALALFLGATSMLPFYLHDRQRRLAGNLYSRDKPLSGNQIMRGPYVNTGSKDVGPDPDWDHATGRCATFSPPSVANRARAKQRRRVLHSLTPCASAADSRACAYCRYKGARPLPSDRISDERQTSR